MDQLNMSNRFKQFLPSQQPMNRPGMNQQQPIQQAPPSPQPMQQGHPMAQMLGKGNPALQQGQQQSAIPVMQPSAQAQPQAPMNQAAQGMAPQAPMNQLPQGQGQEAANPHQAFIQTALQQGLPQEMIMQFLSQKINLR